jgi:hypothetical protein
MILMCWRTIQKGQSERKTVDTFVLKCITIDLEIAVDEAELAPFFIMNVNVSLAMLDSFTIKSNLFLSSTAI